MEKAGLEEYWHSYRKGGVYGVKSNSARVEGLYIRDYFREIIEEDEAKVRFEETGTS